MGKSYSKNKDSLKHLETMANNEQDKMLAVLKQSIKDLVEDANTTVSDGGRMRVDTGFLRSSGVAALNEIPKGPKEGRKRNSGEIGILYSYDSGPINVILAKMKLTDKFYFGWSAWYAEVRESYDGFLSAAIQKWNQIVENNIRRVKK